MSFLYFLATSSKLFKDKLSFYSTYFITDGGFTSCFLIALFVALVFVIAYYCICKVSFKFANILTWLVALVLSGVVSFCYTGIDLGISSKSGSMSLALEKQYKKKINGLTEQQRAPLLAERNKIQKEFKKGFFSANPVNRVCWTDFFLTMIFFYAFSLCINGLFEHASGIPHRGLIGKKN